jgi:hypothetical protein
MVMFRSLLATTAAIVTLVAFSGPTVLTAPQPLQDLLPPAREIVARHIKAIGGEAALAAVSSMRIRGRLEIPSQKIVGELEVLTARPARQLYRVTVPNIGRIENGYDGTIGWSISPAAGPELLSGRQLMEAADDAWFDGPLHAPGHVRELTTLARTDFDGKPSYKIRVVYGSGSERIEYFDANTGLQIGEESARATSQGVVQSVSILRDYRKFGQLLHAGTIVQRALGFEQVLTLTSCEYNVVPTGAFEPPAEVNALRSR